MEVKKSAKKGMRQIPGGLQRLKQNKAKMGGKQASGGKGKL